MTRLLHRWIAAVSLVVALPLLGGDTPPRDWNQCPAVIAIETKEILYALGDTHADYDRLVKLLVAGQLIASPPVSPDQTVWSGGRSTLVVTGDLIDKWNHSLDVIALMRALIPSAAAQGGRVIVQAGNHEAEFLDDPKGSKTQEFHDELEKAGIKPQDVAAGTDSQGIGQFLLCRPFASRVNGWFFSHAGSTKGRTLSQLTADLEKGVDKDGYGAKVLLGDKGLLEARMKPPWWEKSGDRPLESETRLLGYADALGVKHIVFGHQPGTYQFNNGSTRKKGTMFANFDGLVMLIDVGMSQGVDYSKGALLRIERVEGRETASAMFPNGSEQRLWP